MCLSSCHRLLWLLLFLPAALLAQQPLASITADLQQAEPSPPLHLPTLYAHLSPTHLAQQLAFYYLYPNTLEGQEALKRLSQLFSAVCKSPTPEQIRSLSQLSSDAVGSIFSFIHTQTFDRYPPLSSATLDWINSSASCLSNRRLEGYRLSTFDDLAHLPDDQVDLARALLLLEFEHDPVKISEYEAKIDLLALQIMSTLPDNASHLDKIFAINRLIFHDERFRFPNAADLRNQVHRYTRLSAVVDSHLGICLGVTALYLAIAQRIDLPLVAITPPGHIYLSYRPVAQGGKRFGSDDPINIEVTARGICLPNDHYTNLTTPSLTQRTVKEVVGLCLINQGSTLSDRGEYGPALRCYEQARPLLPQDPLLLSLIGYHHLFTRDLHRALAYLQQANTLFGLQPHRQQTMVEDFLHGRVTPEGIQAVFIQTDNSRASILSKQRALQQAVTHSPSFREGLYQLALTYLQLGRTKEAYPILKRCYALSRENLVVAYHLAAVSISRFLYEEAWDYLEQAEQIARSTHHSLPRELRHLRGALLKRSSPPTSIGT